MTSWKDCTNKEYESLINSRPYWNCTTWRFTRRKMDLIITDWRRWWKGVSSNIYETGILVPETEIMKETQWLRIRGHNSVDKELWKIVGSGKPTGSVPKETLAVSVTISISVQKQHSRILLRILSCNRMKRKRREPQVPEVPVEECFDGHARITSKELAPIHSVKNGILQNACSTSPRVDADLVKSALMRIAWLKNSLAEGLKRMVTKVQWLCWKSTRQLGCVFQDMEPPKSSSILRKSSNIRKPIRRVKFRKSRHTSCWLSRPKSIAWNDLPRWSSSAQPQCSKIWGSVSGRDRMARATRPWSSVEAGWKHPKKWRRKIKQHSSLFRKIGACLRHQILNLRKENLLSTLERRCTWSAKRTWILLKWILWRRREVLRQS